MTDSPIRKATTPNDVTPACPPCRCTEPEREFGHSHRCIYGPLRFLGVAHGAGAAPGVTEIVTYRHFMNQHFTSYRVLRGLA
uniref:hypothetical protein n=1 Tax=Pseudonocardia sp. CA-138482 TaxID=3240023 RepID=UPI003F4915F4